MRDRRCSTPWLSVAALLATALLAGCHAPGGSMMANSDGSATYYSTPTQPVSVQVVDVLHEQIIFAMDVPVGRQLTIDFVEGRGDDPALTPDLMLYDVWEIGTRVGRPRNALTVPPASARRIDVYYRGEYEVPEAPPGIELRTDEMLDRPEWWTPEGGPLEGDRKAVGRYDG